MKVISVSLLKAGDKIVDPLDNVVTVKSVKKVESGRRTNYVMVPTRGPDYKFGIGVTVTLLSSGDKV